MAATSIRGAALFCMLGLAMGGCFENDSQPAPLQKATTTVSPSSAPPPPAEIPQTTPVATTVHFSQPTGARLDWEPAAPGTPAITLQVPSAMSVLPGSHEFSAQGLFRLKISAIPQHEELELYPTLEIYPQHPDSVLYLVSNIISVEITEADLSQLAAGVMITKAVYLPDGPSDEGAKVEAKTMVNGEQPGIDPIIAADRQGTIMAILRLAPGDILSQTPSR